MRRIRESILLAKILSSRFGRIQVDSHKVKMCYTLSQAQNHLQESKIPNGISQDDANFYPYFYSVVVMVSSLFAGLTSTTECHARRRVSAPCRNITSHCCPTFCLTLTTSGRVSSTTMRSLSLLSNILMACLKTVISIPQR